MSTEVVHQSWFSRLGKSFVGVLFGIVLFIGSIIGLAWNEGNAIHTANGLKEGAAAVVNLDKPASDAANDDRLVHLSGKASTDAVLKDPFFKVSGNMIKLRRTVEMYQWNENKKESTKTNVGGSTDTTITYSYQKTWSEDLINSSDFHDSGHDNPTKMPFMTTIWTASPVTVGEFTLDPDLVEQMDKFESHPNPETLPKGFMESGDSIYKSANPDSPQIGDLKVKFEDVKAADVSVIALQNGEDLEPYTTKTDTTINMLVYGNIPAAKMFSDAQTANTIATWFFRLLGLFLLFIGGLLVLSPIGILADVIPFLGSVARFGTGLIALLVAIPVGFITIALAWIVYRPLLGITLLVLAIGIPVALLIMKRNKAVPVKAV